MKNLLKPALVALFWPCDTTSDPNPSVYTWGNNVSGQLGLGSEISKAFPQQVEELKRESITSISSSGQCSCSIAINASGELFTWGNGLDGILGQGLRDSNILIPTRVPLDYSFQKVSVGGGHMAGLTTQGKLVTWGLDDCGQCGHEIVKQVVDPRAFRPQQLRGKAPGEVNGELSGLTLVDISCGKYFTAAVTAEGRLYTWGQGRDYSLGHGDRDLQRLPKQVQALSSSKITRVACGRNFTVALDSEGSVYTWGSNDYGQLGVGQTEKYRALPTKLRGLKEITEIACGDFHVLAVNKDGEVYSWGNGSDGQLGHGSVSNQATPSLVAGLPKIAHVMSGGGHSGFITQEFSLMMCGRGTDGQLGRQGKNESIASNRNVPVTVELFSGSRVLQAAGGAHHSMALVINK